MSAQPNTGVEDNSNIDPEILAMSAQPNTGEEDDSNVDPEILAMLEEANQAFKEGLEEQEACDREAELEYDPFDKEFELAFAAWDAENPTDSDRSGACSVTSVRNYGFGSLSDGYRNNDDDARSVGSDNSLFREKIPPVGSRPILKPKSRVRATPAEKAASAMMPFTVSNPENIPAMSFPSNPTWGGAPIPSSGQQTLTFMGVTTSVPVLSDTANLELVNKMGETNTFPSQSNGNSRDLIGLAMQELNTATHELMAAGVHRAALEADVRRLEEDRNDMNLKIADLEARLSEKLDSAAGAQMAAIKELQICRNALAASQQSCNAMNKENGELRRQVSELANAANNLDKESNEIRFTVSELSNHVAFVNGELDSRTRERDFVVQKLDEAQFHIDEAIAANNHQRQQISNMESNAAAKELEVKSLMTALTKSETEKQDLEHKAQEKEDEAQAQAAQAKDEKAKEEKATEKLSKTEQSWKHKYDAASDKIGLAERNAEAYEQDYYDMKGQYKLADIKASQLTSTVAEMKAVAQQKEDEISQLTRNVAKLRIELQELESSREIERANHHDEVEKLKKDYGTVVGEKKYIDQLLDVANDECNSLNKLAARNKKKIEELQEALKTETATTAKLQEQVKKERNSSNDALHVARIANLHRAQRTHGFPRPPRENDRFLIPTLDEQLAAWKTDDGISERFMEDYRRILKENPLTPLKPSKKPKDSSTDADGPSASDKKTASDPKSGSATEVEPFASHKKTVSVSKDSSAAGVGPHEEAASEFDDSSVTAVEPSVSSNETISEPEDASDTENELSRVTYYKPELNKPKNVSSGGGRRPKKDVRYVEQLVYVDKEIIVDKIVEHTVHQARSPIWAFLYVYVDLWIIFAHSFPNFVTYIGRFDPWTIFAHSFPNFVTFIGHFHPANIAGGLSSGIPTKFGGLTRIDIESSKHATTIDVESQTKDPTTATDTEPQTENLTTANAEPDTHPEKVIHKLPPLWPNLVTAMLQLLTLYIVHQSVLILDQRRIWLSANEITRSAVARFWGREPGFFGVAAEPSSWYILKRLCFWVIQATEYSYALPG